MSIFDTDYASSIAHDVWVFRADNILIVLELMTVYVQLESGPKLSPGHQTKLSARRIHLCVRIVLSCATRVISGQEMFIRVQ